MATDRIALIVAGGSGIGAACAETLTERGYKIAILSSSGKGEALAKRFGGFGMTGSNLDPRVLEKFVQSAALRFGRIDAVVNGAGHGPKGPVLELTDEDWRLAMDIYLLNVVRMTRLATPHFITQGGGAMVNISTFATFEPEESFPTSGVFRAGLAAFTKLYADKYAAANVRMNNILPGFIDSLPEKDDRRARIPMGRYGSVKEIADTVAFLLSDQASYITGQNLRVDGGLTRSV